MARATRRSIADSSATSVGTAMAAPPLPGPPEDWRPPREPLLYLLVADVDRAYRDLLAPAALFTQPPTDMPWNHRVATLRDPEGRALTLATPLAG